MPVVFRQGSVTVRIYAPPREHPPPHVHVIFRGVGEVVVEIGTPSTGPSVARDYGVAARLVVHAYQIVADRQEHFHHAWEALHGVPPSE
jgi:hypothetical protein